jgi:hypothetical protein
MRGSVGAAARRAADAPGGRLATRAGFSRSTGAGPATASIANLGALARGAALATAAGGRQAVRVSASAGAGAGSGAGLTGFRSGARTGSGSGFRCAGIARFATTTGAGAGSGGTGSGSGSTTGSGSGFATTTCASSGTIRSALESESLESSARAPAKTSNPLATTVAAALPAPASGEGGGTSPSGCAATRKFAEP